MPRTKRLKFLLSDQYYRKPSPGTIHTAQNVQRLHEEWTICLSQNPVRQSMIVPLCFNKRFDRLEELSSRTVQPGC